MWSTVSEGTQSSRGERQSSKGVRPHLAVRKETSYLTCTEEAEQEAGPDCKTSKPTSRDGFPK